MFCVNEKTREWEKGVADGNKRVWGGGKSKKKKKIQELRTRM